MRLALCLTAAGCSSIGQALGPSVPQARDISIAFESIEGPPREIFRSLVRDLNEEAAALRIAVVPTGGEAAYRIRGYLAAHAEGATTSIAWAWDVYDAELHRAFRLSGEERVGAAAGKDLVGKSWAAADQALLRRIARAGMEQLAGFMASGPAPAAPAPPPAERSGSVVAGRDDLEPETAAVPLPRRRAVLAGLAGLAGLASTARIADATSAR